MAGTRVDVAVVGGGIVGVATAMAVLARARVSLAVVEKEPRLAAHQTGNNSGVIHSGLYYRPGSLKARNCTTGREALLRFCVRARDPRASAAARSSSRPGPSSSPSSRSCGAGARPTASSGLRRLGPEEIREIEPHAAGVAGLFVPQTGIVDYVRVTEAYADEVRRGGGEVMLAAPVRKVARDGDGMVLETSKGEVRCRFLVNCAGLQSDRVARLAGVDPGVLIVPFRGEYYELAPSRHGLVRNLIYPVPDPEFPFLGVHFTRMIAGGVEAGPNAVLALKREGYTRWSFSRATRSQPSPTLGSGAWREATGGWASASTGGRSTSAPSCGRSQALIPEITAPT